MDTENIMGINDIPTLGGAFAPIDHDLVLDDLQIEGEVPPDLSGMFVRNGPNRRFEAAGRSFRGMAAAAGSADSKPARPTCFHSTWVSGERLARGW